MNHSLSTRWWGFRRLAPLFGTIACSSSGLPETPQSEGAPSLEWHTGHGTDFEEHVHEGMETADGGFVAIGQTNEESGSATDILIIKVDAEGQLEWQQQLGTSGQMDVGIAILETPDGHFIAGGGLHSNGQQLRALIRLDASGEVEWTQTYAHSGVGAVRGLVLTEDGAVIATGYTHAEEEGFLFIAEEAKAFLMRVDSDGDMEWEQSLTAPQGTKVHALANGGYRVLSTGWIEENGEDRIASILIETDETGSQTQIHHYSSEGMNQSFDFDRTQDGGAILAGHTTGYGSENWDCLLMRTDAQGELVWTQTFGQPRGYKASASTMNAMVSALWKMAAS